MRSAVSLGQAGSRDRLATFRRSLWGVLQRSGTPEVPLSILSGELHDECGFSLALLLDGSIQPSAGVIPVAFGRAAGNIQCQ